MHRFSAALVAVLLLGGCGSAEEVADDVGITGDEETVATEPQQVEASDIGDALIGGALGAGAGTIVSLGTGDVDPVIPSGSVLTLETENHITL